jgi:hypothetical protein
MQILVTENPVAAGSASPTGTKISRLCGDERNGFRRSIAGAVEDHARAEISDLRSDLQAKTGAPFSV